MAAASAFKPSEGRAWSQGGSPTGPLAGLRVRVGHLLPRESFPSLCPQTPWKWCCSSSVACWPQRSWPVVSTPQDLARQGGSHSPFSWKVLALWDTRGEGV